MLCSVMRELNKSKQLSKKDFFNLTNLNIGESGLVLDIVADSNQYYRQRLLAQGVVPGEILKIKKAAPFGDPIEVVLSSGRSFIIRRQEANIITISKLNTL